MGIKYSKPKSDFMKAIQGKFQKSAVSKSENMLRQKVAPKKVEDHAPHEVYSMTLKLIEESSDFSKAKLVGMRVFHPQDDSAALETVCHHTNSGHKYAGINSGNHVKATRVALMLAEELSEVQNIEYEFAFLQVSSLYIMAIWLKAKDNWKKDIFIPLIPPKKKLLERRSLKSLSKRRKLSVVRPTKVTDKTISLSGRAYFAEDFLKMLKKTNESRVRFDATPKDD